VRFQATQQDTLPLLVCAELLLDLGHQHGEAGLGDGLLPLRREMLGDLRHGGPEGFRILLRDEDGDGQLPGRSRHAARRGNEQGHVVDDGPEALLNIAHHQDGSFLRQLAEQARRVHPAPF